jgi:hypothetical protein
MWCSKYTAAPFLTSVLDGNMWLKLPVTAGRHAGRPQSKCGRCGKEKNLASTRRCTISVYDTLLFMLRRILQTVGFLFLSSFADYTNLEAKIPSTFCRKQSNFPLHHSSTASVV